jgi:hypothetical protein
MKKLNNPMITVIMPCYNAQDTLRCAVESVLTQSVTDFELLIIDDGSTDVSVAVARDLAVKDKRIRLIRQHNAGPAEARNRGLAEATGQYIAFLDADDRWAPNLLERHLAQFAAHADCGVSFARVRFYDKYLRRAGSVSAAVTHLQLGEVLGEYPVCTTSNLMCRREVYEAAGGFDPSLTHGEDQEWIARVLATTPWQVRGVKEILVHYRTSPGGLSAELEKMQEGWEAMLECVRSYAPKEVAKAEPEADALFHRYLARRALRTGQPRLSLQPLLRAWRVCPRALLRHAPSRTLLTTAGVLAAMLPFNPTRILLAR